MNFIRKIRNLGVILTFVYSCISCNKVEIGSPIPNSIDTSWYTVSGKYINGTTNKPYRNIELTLMMDNYGFPRVLKTIEGPILTNDEGNFSFSYQHINEIAGLVYLKVFPTDLYPTVDSITINQNFNKTVYMSDYSRLILELNPITASELYVYTGKSDTLHYTNILSTKLDTVYQIPLRTTLVAWGRTMEELRDALKGKNSNQQYVKTTGDPFYNKFKITF